MDGCRKSSYSGYNNGDCAGVAWRKSSHSAYNGNCVEAAAAGIHVLVRDSKHPGGLPLEFTPRQWHAFLDRVKAGELDALAASLA